MNALATPLTINLGIGEPHLEPDATLRSMAAAAATASWRYSANAGHLSLRQAIASHYDDRYDPQSEVCVTAGTEEGLYAVMQALVDEGHDVLVPDPGFVAYSTLVRMAGGTPRPYALDPEGWDVDLAALEKAWTPSTRAVIVNSPSNPTGGVAGGETMRRVAAMAKDRGAVVISDEVYREIHYEERPASLSGENDHVIVVSGLSKSHGMTGLRLGWILAGQTLMTPVLKAHQYIATCASVFSQDLALRIFSAPEWNAGWLDGVRAQMRRQRDAAVAAASAALQVPVEAPRGAFYLFVPVPSCDTVGLARALAIDAAVLTIPGIAFGRRGEGFLRVSFAAEVETLQHGMDRIGRHLAAAGR